MHSRHWTQVTGIASIAVLQAVARGGGDSCLLLFVLIEFVFL